MAGTPKLIILSEQLRGQSFELSADEYTLGRTEEADICVPDPTVSSNHCALKRSDEAAYAVVDKGSTNGTRVNGVRLEPDDPQELVNSDILQVGGVEMLFDCEDTRGNATSSTQTVINLENTKTGELPVSNMTNFSPFGPRDGNRRDSTAVRIGITAVIGLLAVLVLVSLVFLMFKLIGS